MTESENLRNLKEISSTVSERDLKIWENVAHSICIQKHTEKLKSEIARMKQATAEKKKQNKMLENQLAELVKTIEIQKWSLSISKRSLVMEWTYRDSLVENEADFRKKYAETMDMYNDELKVYREIYENASQGYKELKTQQTEIKKLEVKKMMMDAKVESLERSQKQYRDIQEMIFRTTIVKFAEFYTLYHEREKIQKLVGEKKNEEQQLLKEHLRLAEAVKQKKMQYQKRITVGNPSFDNTNRTHTASKENKEPAIDRLQKFLNEEILPCSLTSIASTSRVVANQDNSKVRILDDRVIKPLVLPPRPPSVRKPNPELRKKMEDIMQAAKNEMKRSNSFQTGQMQRSPHNSQKSATPSGTQQNLNGETQQSQMRARLKLQESQIKGNSQQKSQIQKNPQPPIKTNLQQQAQIKMHSQPQGPKLQQQSQIKATSQQQQQQQANLRKEQQPRFGSQENNHGERRMKSSQEKEPLFTVAPEEVVTKQVATNSILKPSSQENVNKVDVNKYENVSKFFNQMKKTVTFQNGSKKETPGVKFQLFSMEEKKSDTGTVVKNMDIFQRPFTFKDDDETNMNEPITGTGSTPETGNGTNNISFSMETAPPTFETYGDPSEKRNEVTFDLETSFNRNFGQPPPNPTTDENPTAGFSFFGSQVKSNPFSFF